MLLLHKLTVIIFRQKLTNCRLFSLKTFINSVQNHLLCGEMCPENFHEICHFLPKQPRWYYLACSGALTVSLKKKVFFLCTIIPALTVGSRWLDIGSVFVTCLWTSTLFRPVSLHVQKELGQVGRE